MDTASYNTSETAFQILITRVWRLLLRFWTTSEGEVKACAQVWDSESFRAEGSNYSEEL